MKQREINITCDHCSKTHSVRRTPEIPNHVVSMGCNWCPNCEGEVDDYYEEWYNESDHGDKQPDQPINQLGLFTLWPTEKDFEDVTIHDKELKD